jgi:hypothetical protein
MCNTTLKAQVHPNSLVSWFPCQVTKEQWVFLDILVNENTVRPQGKPTWLPIHHPLQKYAVLSTTNRQDKNLCTTGCCTGETRRLSEAQKISAVRQAFNGPLTAEKGQIHSWENVVGVATVSYMQTAYNRVSRLTTKNRN